ncbi:MAG: MarR family transcriptional regulator [Candidatus Woesearchaeota archaeon]|nr:MarR family transcriptional regulator [Candidatus Woesearchaeota archaeon]
MITFACQDIEFSDLLRCSFNLNKTQYNVMMFLLRTDKPCTATVLGEKMKLDRTTVQKAVKLLAEKELILRYQDNLDSGGYTFYYKIKDKDMIKQRMLNIVDKWHEEVRKEIDKW